MSSLAQPRADLVAVFHTSFHPTRGNIISWSKQIPNDLTLDGIEFSSLPSGLHVVDDDVIYLTKGGYRGVCVFQRRKSDEEGARGFRMETVGLLVDRSPRSFPWRHLPALKEIATTVLARDEGWDWTLLERWFEQRKLRPEQTLSTEQLLWEDELSRYSTSHPVLHLPHLLRILGPSSLTLYKHVLARRRVLIYTQPPVEPSCLLAYIASDICFGDRNRQQAGTGHAYLAQPPSVLGMVTLNDLDLLQSESWNGNGWIACTTDAIFLEKPYLYDLVVNMSTANWATQSRPTLSVSRFNPASVGTKRPTHRLHSVRFTWSDLRLWSDLDRILRSEASLPTPPTSPPRIPTPQPSAIAPLSMPGELDEAGPPLPGTPAWADPWRIYEDACVVCASVWLSGLRSAVGGAFLPGWQTGDPPRLEGDDVALAHGVEVRKVGQGIEGRPIAAPKTPARLTTPVSVGPLSSKAAAMPQTTHSVPLSQQVRTTLALLNAFHSHTAFLLDRLGAVLGPDPGSADAGSIVLTPRDFVALELGPLSDLDARFVVWIAEQTEAAAGRKVVVKRSWRDLLAAVFGFG